MQKQYPKKRNIHRPPHLYLNRTIYFITSRTFNMTRYFYDNKRKKMFLEVLKQTVYRLQVKIYAWVILDNHYHIMVGIDKGFLLPSFI